MPDILPRSSFQNVEWLQNNAFASYAPSNQDVSSATYQYYGFQKKTGDWYIQRFKIDVANVIIYGYAKGSTLATYDANWDANGNYIGTLTFVSYANL